MIHKTSNPIEHRNPATVYMNTGLFLHRGKPYKKRILGVNKACFLSATKISKNHETIIITINIIIHECNNEC